jgi:MazG family protein
MSKQVTRLLRIMAKLRSPTGCAWDREQTHASLISCLKNETDEVVHAIRTKDVYGLKEELGDLLLQVVFHSQLAREAGKFDFDGVVQTLTRKLVRRHPHVFGKARARDTATVLKQWDEIKAREKRDKRHGRNRKKAK